MNKVLFENEEIKVTKLQYPKYTDVRLALKDAIEQDDTFYKLKLRMYYYSNPICKHILKCVQELVDKFPEHDFVDHKNLVLQYCIERFNENCEK
jgi:hypothetical protein